MPHMPGEDQRTQWFDDIHGEHVVKITSNPIVVEGRGRAESDAHRAAESAYDVHRRRLIIDGEVIGPDQQAEFVARMLYRQHMHLHHLAPLPWGDVPGRERGNFERLARRLIREDAEAKSPEQHTVRGMAV